MAPVRTPHQETLALYKRDMAISLDIAEHYLFLTPGATLFVALPQHTPKKRTPAMKDNKDMKKWFLDGDW